MVITVKSVKPRVNRDSRGVRGVMEQHMSGGRDRYHQRALGVAEAEGQRAHRGRVNEAGDGSQWPPARNC